MYENLARRRGQRVRSRTNTLPRATYNDTNSSENHYWRRQIEVTLVGPGAREGRGEDVQLQSTNKIYVHQRQRTSSTLDTGGVDVHQFLPHTTLVLHANNLTNSSEQDSNSANPKGSPPARDPPVCPKNRRQLRCRSPPLSHWGHLQRPPLLQWQGRLQ